MTPQTPMIDTLDGVPRAYVEAALRTYQRNIDRRWHVDVAIPAIADLTARLGGIPEGAYVYVPVGIIDGRLRYAAPSDRWTAVDGHARLRVIGHIDGPAPRRLVVVRPDSYRTTGETINVAETDAIWCL